MNYLFRSLSSIICLLLVVGCQTTGTKESSSNKRSDPYKGEGLSSIDDSAKQYVFGWGMMPHDLAKPKGGTTRGAKIQLSQPIPVIAGQGHSKFEKDRLAILALAGDFKVDFHFMETIALTEAFEPRNGYNSWGTEHVHVLEDSGEFISLQHTLVMFFENENGISEPMVMKHWRQDWSYEDKIIYKFKGDLTWDRESLVDDEAQDTWSQAVFQVDDSPRYEVVGSWEHRGNLSRWVSNMDSRPLPRREYSQRSDYQLLEGEHRIILTPFGWVHEQNNWKRVDISKLDVAPTYLSQEFGINRYERITKPDVASAAKEYWQDSGDYWDAVRGVWRDLMSERESISLHSKVDGKSQYVVHFQNAETAKDVIETARQSVMSFIK
ncbi:hypothetical protein OAH76_03860 [Verrucomicrobia bacterium]|nr:hypothetical protein [Verrucomicrobiota bacterium]